MRLMSKLIIVFYSFLFLLIGVFLILLSVNFFSRGFLTAGVDYLYLNPNIKIILGASGGIIICIALFVLQTFIGMMQSERTIAFDNPDGRVTLSLSAIEDFIKKLVKQIPEVKEFKPTVVATKKGVDITNRVVLFTDISIPEVTEKIQSLVKNRIQDMLGIEEAITVKVDVVKIVQREEKKAEKHTQVETQEKTQQAQYRGLEY